ncbi:MAG: HPr family phosphocarrier protein, partial [Erysipelotrichaceae bacterium]|nr:HPr family phosphocarrier protein [Erysipelotrichaceae bacterium]
MKEFKCVVTNPIGIHARHAALLAQLCVSLKSSVTLFCNDKQANGNNVLEILALNARKGDSVTVRVEGENEEEDTLKVKKQLCEKDCSEETATSILKIAFYNTKDYDRTFFSQLEKEKGPGTYNCEITYLESRLTKETASL